MSQNNMIDDIKNMQQVVTHSGKFHADDVFSFALLQYINPNIEVLRKNAVPEDFSGLVFDIGGGVFDHHQPEKEVRENGVTYAAFGLLWRAIGSMLVGEEDAERFDIKFVQPLDQNDNFGDFNSIANIISNFNPTWDSDVNPDDAFMQAVDWAKKVLTAEFTQMASRNKAIDMVLEELPNAKDNILVLSRSLPWRKALSGTSIEFVIYPSNRGGYCAQCVPSEEEGTALKCPFPKKWGGLTAEELQKISNLPTASFSHSNNFLFVAETLEDTIAACKIAQSMPKTPSRPRTFVNFTNHKSCYWSPEQIAAAKEYGPLVDVLFPYVDPNATEDELLEKAKESIATIRQYRPKVVLCQGEFGLSFLIIRLLKEMGITVVEACSERETLEQVDSRGVTTKVSKFRFVKFREYI